MDLSENGEGGIWVFDEVELPKGWVFDQLGNRCTVRRGASPRPAGHPRYFGGGTIPWIKIGDATNTGSRFIERTAEHVNEEGAKCSVHIPAGSLIIANSGVSLGFAAITRVPGCIHDGWLLTTDFRELDRDYLYYCINVATRRLRQLADGTTQPNLNTGIARRLMLPLPPLAEQKAIAGVLGALDDKIELNRRMNATLEAMARALFQSWFVDFDPVRAKLDGRPPAALDPATAALFPDSFQDSELGHIPRGWEVKSLGEVIELAYGKPLKAEDRKNGPICVYGANGPVGWHDEKLVSGPGIVVGRKGNPGVVTWAHSDFYPIDTTFYVEPKGRCRSLYFLFYALSNHDLANLSADSAVPGLNRNHAYMSKQVIPPAPLLEAFDKQAAPIFAAIHAHEIQSRTLATLRDTLLPKLLSGELSVANGIGLAESKSIL